MTHYSSVLLFCNFWKHQKTLLWIWKIMTSCAWTEYFNPLQPSATFLYLLKTSENLQVFNRNTRSIDSNHIYRENFLGKRCINSRPLFIIFNHLFGCTEANFRPLRWQTVSLAYLILIIVLYHYLIKRSLVVGLGPKTQPSTSVGFELEIFRSAVEFVTHCTYCNFGK